MTIEVKGVQIPKDSIFFVLEDMENYHVNLKKELFSMGFRGKYLAFYTLKDALDNLDKYDPDIFISDWNLPDGQGIALLDVVRSDAKNAKKPFMMMTTIDDVNKILDAIKKGADGYVVKPWQMGDIEENLSHAYHKRTS